MNIDILYHARVIMDIQVAIKERGVAVVKSGTQESLALAEGNALVNSEHMAKKLGFMIDHGHAIFERKDWDEVMKLKAALAEAGGQPLENPNKKIDEEL
jgi:hypothetical protein